MFCTRRIAPTGQVDRCWKFKSLVIERFAKIREFSAGSNIRFNIIVPEFNRRVTGLSGDPDLVQDGGRSDGAGVQTVLKRRHCFILLIHGTSVMAERGLSFDEPTL